MKPDSIGECVYVLHHKLWGRTPINGRPRSKGWWEARLEYFINVPNLIEVSPLNGKPADFNVVPYEVEYGLSNQTDCIGWLIENQQNDLTKPGI